MKDFESFLAELSETDAIIRDDALAGLLDRYGGLEFSEEELEAVSAAAGKKYSKFIEYVNRWDKN